mgnify:CR=1 FL=1
MTCLPGFWTHILYGSDVLQTVGLDLDGKGRDYFNLGCLFTDPCRYCSKETPEFLLWRLSHTLKCGSFADALCRELEGFSRFYVIGVFTHYYLDAIANCYIVARAGNSYKREQLEIAIDKTILRQRTGSDILRLEPGAELPDGSTTEIEEAFASIARGVYGLEGVSFSRALNNMNSTFQMFYRKKGMLLFLRKIFLKNERPEKAYFTDTHIDPLNHETRPWFHSIAGWESKETFERLYERAIEELGEFLAAYLDGRKDWSLPALSLTTGLPLMETL